MAHCIFLKFGVQFIYFLLKAVRIMAVPKYYEFHKPILEFLGDGQERTNQEIRAEMVHKFHLSDEDAALTLTSGQPVLNNRIGWATTYLKKAELIKNTARGVFMITDDGLKALRNAPEVITPKFLKRYKPFNDFVSRTAQGERKPLSINESGDDSPMDSMDRAYSEIEGTLEDDLLKEIMKLSPPAFEKLVVDLLMKMGYGGFENAGRTTVVSGDEGIDGVIYEDKLGFNRIFIQAKQWDISSSIGRPTIQGFVGAIAGRDGKGLFVTTADFSQPARDYAKTQHIVLINGKMLVRLMVEHNFCVSIKHAYEIKAVDEDALSDYQNE